MIYSFTAPAKINLFLHVVGQRSDGYHQLQSAFQFLDLADTVTIEVNDTGRIERPSGAAGVAEEDDLVVRAARALQSHSGTPKGATIRVDKRIPAGAGLGGGSSNAATVLIALNALWGTRFARDELCAIGLRLGADVPVFVHGRSAWAEGVGERLTPLDYAERPGILVVPEAHVPTPEIFADPKLERQTPSIDRDALHQGDVHNDLEAVAERLYPEVGSTRDRLQELLDQFAPGQHATPARMTGSGSAVFALIGDPIGQKPDPTAATRLADSIARKYADSSPNTPACRLVCRIRTRNRHPLLSNPSLIGPALAA